MTPLLECRSIEKIYGEADQAVRALRGVSLQIEAGQLVCVTGRSGSGKTTLLNCLGSLDRVTRGEILLEGTALHHLDESKLLSIRRRNYGYIFQNVFLFPHLSALDNVAAPLVYRGETWPEARKRSRALLADLGLAGEMLRRARVLSGGEAQRVAVARALISKPRILVGDEPTGELDSVSSGRIVGLLSRLAREGTAVLVASHDPLMEKEAGVLIRLEDGRVVETSKPTASAS